MVVPAEIPPYDPRSMVLGAGDLLLTSQWVRLLYVCVSNGEYGVCNMRCYNCPLLASSSSARPRKVEEGGPAHGVWWWEVMATLEEGRPAHGRDLQDLPGIYGATAAGLLATAWLHSRVGDDNGPMM